MVVMVMVMLTLMLTLGPLFEASWRSFWKHLGGRFGSLLEVSWRSLGGLLEVSWRSHGIQLEVGRKSSWQFFLRYGADDVETSSSVAESLWLAMDLSWS